MENTQKKKKRLLFILLACLLGAALITGGVLLGLHLAGNENKPANNPSGNFVIDGGAGDWADDTPPNSGGASSGIKIPGYPEIPVAANQRDIRIALLNPEGNPCYFKFQIVLDKNGNGVNDGENGDEVLYTSDWCPPGKAISQQTLSRGLAAGSYAAFISIRTASLDESHTPMNGSDVKTTITVVSDP